MNDLRKPVRGLDTVAPLPHGLRLLLLLSLVLLLVRLILAAWQLVLVCRAHPPQNVPRSTPGHPGGGLGEGPQRPKPRPVELEGFQPKGSL